MPCRRSNYILHVVSADFYFEYASVCFVSTRTFDGVRRTVASDRCVRIVIEDVLEIDIDDPTKDLHWNGPHLVGRGDDEIRFLFNREALELHISFGEGVSHARGTQLLLDWVIPYVLTTLGYLVLHATAVSIDGEAWGFIGMSGRGKSTMAVALATQGYPLVADDTFVLDRERTTVLPSHPTARLLTDSMRSLIDSEAQSNDLKTILSQDDLRFQGASLPLGGLFLLNPPGALMVGDSSAIDVPALLEQTYILPGEGIAAGLDEVVRLVESNVVHTLTYPRNFSQLPEVTERVLAFVHEKSEGSS